jgi:hypothetical protein
VTVVAYCVSAVNLHAFQIALGTTISMLSL